MLGLDPYNAPPVDRWGARMPQQHTIGFRPTVTLELITFGPKLVAS